MSEDHAPNDRERGPFCYEHWKSVQGGVETPRWAEIACFTDALITGEEAESYGPYRLLNTMGGREAIRTGRPALVLRVESTEEGVYDPPQLVQTDTSRYHGGQLEDEITALVSLELGVRLKPGRVVRLSWLISDPKGRPYEGVSRSDPILLTGGAVPVMPYTTQARSLNDVKLLRTLPHLQPRNASALIRAARSYQDALWISDTEPHLAWVMFVSAVESAAQYWKTRETSSVALLKEFNPDLYAMLTNVGNQELLKQVASHVGEFSKATKKFVSFLAKYLPNAPRERPKVFAQHPWKRQAIKDSLRTIYGHRSDALHKGTPFPMPMCRPPWFYGDGSDPHPEIPFGDVVHCDGGTWLKEDIPMLLHTFEFIVRNALLNWWRSMLPE